MDEDEFYSKLKFDLTMRLFADSIRKGDDFNPVVKEPEAERLAKEKLNRIKAIANEVDIDEEQFFEEYAKAYFL